ncbi:signal recognition particle-docking protein FtsY [uncultured Paraglaciecola sp.]|uniref:signal recognition particle-docking protein FtsY n=1 Tax=uncultured Paraglaciecola sp. TaxID=1765024 RepID=UPI0030DCC668|tara:strand:+ start:30577 stop:31971 length:1395 start_codon:yes stop_codon:yes gene_type:complete
MSKFFGWLKKDKPKSEPQDTPKSASEEAQVEHQPATNQGAQHQGSEEGTLVQDVVATEVEASSSPHSSVEVEIALHEENISDEEIVSPEVSETPLVSKVEQDADAQTPEVKTPVLTDNTPEPQIEAIKPEPEKNQEKPAKIGLFAKLKQSLSRTKESLGSGLVSLFRGKAIDDELFEELETQLLVADVGIDTTSKIIAKLTEGAKRNQLKDGDALYQLLKQQMSNILQEVSQPLEPKSEDGPFVILMVGVNGVGKTTTIGKMAKQFQAQGKKVMLAAGDTFRAAAVEQLQVWGERNNIPVIAQKTGSDSASVIYDALESAKARNVDVLIADTAGRLQNKDHLMEELKKVVRVMRKVNPASPHEIMLTLDAATGQNAISQTKLFNQAVGLTGITLTKLDGTAKGGVIFALADQFKIPIRYIGVGEGIDDLRPFVSDEFVEALFSENNTETNTSKSTSVDNNRLSE